MDRRRRALAEELALSQELAPASASDDGPAAASGPREAYIATARRQHQPRLTDLLPVRAWAILAWLVAGGLAVGGLLYAHTWSTRLAGVIGTEAAAALDLSAPANLATWLSSVLFGAASAISLIVFSLRQHRIDDYRARYRVWIWTALVALLLSVDAVAGVGRLAEGIVASLGENGVAWRGWAWPTVCLALLAAFGLRVIVEVRHCRGGALALVVAAGLWTAATVVARQWIGVPDVQRRALVATGLLLSGQLFVLLGLVLFARQVMREVEGTSPGRAKVKRRKVKPMRDAESSDATEPSAERKLRIDPPERPQSHIAARTDLAPMRASVGLSSSSNSVPMPRLTPAAPTAFEGLTRAERKKLKRQMRQQSDD